MSNADHDYIPKHDAEFNVWVRQFAQYAQAHAGELGLSPAEVAEIAGAQAAFAGTLSEHLRLHAEARGAFEEKVRQRKETERVVRSRAQVIQARPETTDAQREELGLRVPDRIRTPSTPDRVRHIAGPSVLLDWSARKQITVHAGLNPANEHENALPEGTWAIRLYCRIGEGPETLLAEFTRSPFIHLVETSVPVTVVYRACYVDRQGRPGPLGQPVSCTVSV